MAVNNIFGASSIDDLADNVLSGVDDFMLTVEKMQKRKVASNVQLVVQALKKIESDLQDKYDGVTTVIEKRISTIKDGRDGINGRDGRDGKDGRPGKDGMPGARGKDGAPGKDGADGMDGVSVIDARIDFDGSLIIVLSSGREINVGEVVTPDLAERIKVITNGGGTSQSVLDTLASLQAQINLISSALVYAGTWNASTNTPTLASGVGTANTFYIVSVAGTTTLNGISNWGVGDWAIFNGTVWQRIEGGAEGNFTNLSVSGNATLGDAVGDSVTVNATATFNNADVTIQGVRVGRGAGAVATNTAVGSGALASNTSGVGQTAVGFSALGQSTGSRNVAFGGGDAATYNAALAANTSGTDNAAFGIGALSANLTGVGNTSLGVGSLYFSTASNNTAVGFQAGAANQTGTNLVLVGRAAGFSNKASNNTFVGYSAGYSNDTGTYNTFVGVNAGLDINTGAKNTIIGSYSGNQGGLDIRTASNYIVLSDGDGNPRAYWNGANPTFPGNATFSGGTANGVAYLNGSKVLTTGSALTFDGTILGNALTANATYSELLRLRNNGVGDGTGAKLSFNFSGTERGYVGATYSSGWITDLSGTDATRFLLSGSEQMRLTSTGLGIGTSSPSEKLQVTGNILQTWAVSHNRFIGTQFSTTYENGLRFLEASRETQIISKAADSSDKITFYTGVTPTERMRLDSSGNLGINCTADSRLRVLGAVDGTGPASLRVGFNSQSVNYFDADTQYFRKGDGTNTLTIDSSGNLGLGVTPSAWATYGNLQLPNSRVLAWSGSSYITANAYYNAGWKYIITAPASYAEQDQGAFKFYTAPSGTAGAAISFTQAMTLDASGNLGIGITNPAYKLVVSNAGAAGLEVDPAGVNGGPLLQAYNRSGAAYVQLTYDCLQYIWRTSGSERARITSGGYFKASNAGTYLGSTGDYHELRSSNDNYLLYAINTRNGGNGPFGISVEYSAQDPNGTGNEFLQCVGISTLRAEIRSNGGLANYSANDVNLSDRREKTNFAPAKSYLDTICAIPVQTFNYIDQSEDDPGLTLGVVAQDVQAVAPELVMESNWGSKDDPKMRLSIYQTDLQYALMKCIQELKAEVDSLKAQLKGV